MAEKLIIKRSDLLALLKALGAKTNNINQEDIIRMAKESGLYKIIDDWMNEFCFSGVEIEHVEELYEFVNLIINFMHSEIERNLEVVVSQFKTQEEL